uniref:Uncharacterized protein n=1 Tax=Panagrolaimus sp. ES5 TaxID=591445 RepID=A0AC34G3N0_9BILA
MIRTINGTRCYTCQTGPERIICSMQTECNGKACYVIMDGNYNVAGCTADIDPLTRLVGCYNQTSTRSV